MNNSYSNTMKTTDTCFVWNVKSVFTLIICIAIPLIVGMISSFLTGDAMVAFNSLNKPPLAPPAWLFPVAWTVLYILMGTASFLIFRSTDSAHSTGMLLYVIQLIFNFVWSLIFFNIGAYVLAAAWLAILLLTIIALIINTAQYSKAAMIMLIPYAAWCCFAMYLNVGIAMLN